MRSKESVEQEIANLEEEHRRNEETWRNNLEEIEEKQMSILNEADYDNMLEAGTPKSESSSASRITTSKSEQTTRQSSRKRKRSYGKSD
jgi:transketolase